MAGRSANACHSARKAQCRRAAPAHFPPTDMPLAAPAAAAPTTAGSQSSALDMCATDRSAQSVAGSADGNHTPHPRGRRAPAPASA
eukprot:392173-Pleurochrysis_carterae.AAC.1